MNSKGEREPEKKRESEKKPRKLLVYYVLVGSLLAFIATISMMLIPRRTFVSVSQQNFPVSQSKSNPRNVWQLLADSDLNIRPPSEPSVAVTSAEITAPEIPLEVAQTYRPRPKKIFPEGQVVTSVETKPNDKGFFLKVSVMKTDFKYPLIRVAQAWYIDPSKNNDAGSAEFVAESAMVADHFMLQLNEDAPADEVEAFLKDQGAYVRDAHLESSMLLIGFDGVDPHSMGRILSAIQKNAWVKSVSPDYIAISGPH